MYEMCYINQVGFELQLGEAHTPFPLKDVKVFGSRFTGQLCF